MDKMELTYAEFQMLQDLVAREFNKQVFYKDEYGVKYDTDALAIIGFKLNHQEMRKRKESAEIFIDNDGKVVS